MGFGDEVELGCSFGIGGDLFEGGGFIEEGVDFFENELGDDESLGKGFLGFTVFLDGIEDGGFVGDAGKDGFFDGLLFGNVDHFVGVLIMLIFFFNLFDKF